MYYIYQEHKDKAVKIVVSCINTDKRKVIRDHGYIKLLGKNLLLGPLPLSVLCVCTKYVSE